MMEAYKKFWQNYFNFSGRSRRSDYWYVVLVNMIISLVISILGTATGMTLFSTLASIYSLVSLIPGIAIIVRRLHDIGKSGWYCLFVLIPLVGGIIVIIWLATDSQPDANVYGENPKAVIVEEINVNPLDPQ